MSESADLVKRMREEAADMPPFMRDLLSEAADMIESRGKLLWIRKILRWESALPADLHLGVEQ